MLVCNSKIAGCWGDEKREIHNPLQRGADVKVRECDRSNWWCTECLSIINITRRFLIRSNGCLVYPHKTQKHTNILADIKLGDEGWVAFDCVLEKMFAYELFFCFRLCWNWLKTRLKWNFLMDRKSSFQIVLVWVPSATSESQETLNWNPSRSAKRYNCKQMLCLTL